MKATEAIKAMLEDTGTTQAQLAKGIGRNPNAIYNMFSLETDVKVGTLAKMCEVLGYKLYVESPNGEKLELTPKE